MKVFDRTLSTTADTLVRAIHWAVGAGARVINLSLGTAAQSTRLPVGRRGYASNAVRLSSLRKRAMTFAGFPAALPASFRSDSIGRARGDCYDDYSGDRTRFLASGYPRPIPGVPVESQSERDQFCRRQRQRLRRARV